jgi:MFS family permease
MSNATEKQFFYGYLVVTAAFFTMIVLWASFYAFGVFFKPIVSEFGWSRAVTSGAFSLCSIFMGGLSIAMGGLNDRLGPRLVMTLSGLLLGTGYLLMSQLQEVWQMYLFYGVILGTGMGGGFVPMMTTVVRWFVQLRGFMTGIVAAGIGIGALIGPPIVNWLILTYGWRRSYGILGITVAVFIVSSAQVLRTDPSHMGISAFGQHRNRKQDPIPETGGVSFGEAVHSRSFWLLFSLIFCFGFCVFSVMVHMVAHAIELGSSPGQAARILATIGGLSIVGKLLLGRAVDIIGSRKVFIIGFAMMAAASFWVIPARMTWMLYSFAWVFGFAYGGCVTAESPIVAELFGLRSHGLILGVIAFAFATGGAFGPWLCGYLFDLSGAYRWSFFACATLSTMGLALSMILRPDKAMVRERRSEALLN